MLRFLIPLCLFLSGCALWPWSQSEPETVIVVVPGCDRHVALARAVVAGRQAGQSRREQQVLVDDTSILAPIHRATVDAVYDWPRPTNPAGWSRLSAEAAAAAEARCVNRPAQLIRGGAIP